MSELNPNGESLKGGVLLGGRELRLTISRDEYDLLKRLTLAASSPKSVHELAHELLSQGLRATWQQYLRVRFVYQLTQWMWWA